MEQLKNFKMIDLGDKLRLLSDNDFYAWLKALDFFMVNMQVTIPTYIYVPKYFPEFLCRKRFGDISKVFYNFWYHVSFLSF